MGKLITTETQFFDLEGRRFRFLGISFKIEVLRELFHVNEIWFDLPLFGEIEFVEGVLESDQDFVFAKRKSFVNSSWEKLIINLGEELVLRGN